MTSAGTGKGAGLTVLTVLAVLLAAGSAQAATRYAAPGGTGTEPCINPQRPCTIYLAADATPGIAQAGDEVVMAPGEYTDTAGDLGPSGSVQLVPGISVHGEAGAVRPLVTLQQTPAGPGAFVVEGFDKLSHVEIDTSVAKTNLAVFGGTVDDTIVRNTSTVAGAIACMQVAGTIRDSVCLASAAESVALGMSRETVVGTNATLRNVTAVDTGPESAGLYYAVSGGGGVNVNAKAVIAKGVGDDVVADRVATGAAEGHVTIQLDHSSFEHIRQYQALNFNTFITSPGADGNVLGEPLLAADGYHELEGSPTIDAGAVDGFSGSADVDGQSRSIGTPDIGADELLHPTAVSVSCVPAEVVLTDPKVPISGTDCRARVSDETSPGFIAPTGTVTLSSSSGGEFSATSCTLVPSASGAEANCAVHYTPKLGSAGTHTITSSYVGDGSHAGSLGTASVSVSEAPLVCAPSAGAKHRRHCRGPRKRRRALSVHLQKKPMKKTTKRLAKFTFKANRRGARFECKLDKGRYRACRSSFRNRVKPGRHRFSVRAVKGKLRSKPARYSWRVVRPKRR